MRLHIPFNDNWRFTDCYSDEICTDSFDDKNLELVRIPHTLKVTDFHYFDESVYQKVCGYRKVFKADPSWKGSRVIVHFEAVAHVTKVYINNIEVCSHGSGYTAFEADITDYINYDSDNILSLRVSGTESDNVPPFGHVVDYMTYTGIYRPVSLEIRPQNYIKDIFVRGLVPGGFKYNEKSPADNKIAAAIKATVTLMQEDKNLSIRLSFKRFTDAALATDEKIPEKLRCAYDLVSRNVESDSYYKETVLGTTEIKDKERDIKLRTLPVSLWDTMYPAMYVLKAELLNGAEVIDLKEIRFGFRKTLFKADGFYLNGRKFRIRGLNRHQSYPYAGYAMPKSMQVMDADILRNELSLNAVRTSHYPQSHDFINRCDELGMLVFMEFPGWQHIGDDKWKDQALVNLEEMITQFRNHASIMLWGVRINESVDDDEFYTKTNELSRKLDDSRQTGGVRAKDHSSLLEDVYTYNDFSHDGKRPGCAPRKKITSDEKHAYLITEYNGHMFPCKAFDAEERRTEHAIRHANVIDCVASYKDIAGSFGWCMFDYNTHKDFGSGDRICYHGVMDMFRNPKLAAAVYESQRDEHPVLEISSSMDIGEHNECIRGDVWMITNADSVRFYKNDIFIHEYMKSESPYKNLLHGPILVDDYIGDQIEKNEKYGKKQCDDIKLLMNRTARFGMGGIGIKGMLKAGKLMAIKHMGFDDALRLYNKYIGDWGGKSTVFKFEAVKDGKVVKTVIKSPSDNLSLEIRTDHTNLKEAETYDVACVRIRAVDQNGNVASFANEPVVFTVSGPVEIYGPSLVSLQGGMGGCYIRTKGQSGKASLKIHTEFGEKIVEFNVNSNR
ncbi:MAG: glycoside hydrolase family 2 protein [Butyrivibrio sp.]|uniref:glycoside hydrolase family 2 protein n=1 Tax=Butyrivibrio sp. TaxID=28121 RepID=UPI0025FC8D3E|nr:glycoside hydrolase family 2 TIM barrel-domain containing protein [Butyrivibrio sp.]MCR5771966.1 glycoside hydrolase family 2 protein [Butyrivibrio sp.]